MDVTKCISDVIAKYRHLPDVEADFLKVLRYCEVEHRLFFKQFLKNKPRTAHAHNTRTLNFIKDQLNNIEEI